MDIQLHLLNLVNFLSHRKGFLQAEEVAQRFRLTLLWPWRGTDDPTGIGGIRRCVEALEVPSRQMSLA